MKTAISYNKGINFLRAIAILGIVFYHIYPWNVRGGFLGVCFFFLISGYLAVRQAEARYEKQGIRPRLFYIKKFLRIYPPMYIMVMSVVAFLTLFHKDLLIGIREEVFSILLGYNNWWQWATQTSYFQKVSEHSLLTHLWYMGVEIQLLIVWPWLYLFYKKVAEKKWGKKAILYWVLLAVLSIVLMMVLYDETNINRVYYGTDTRSFAFFFGVILGLKEDDWIKFGKNRLDGVLGFILVALLTLAMVVSFFTIEGFCKWLYFGGMAGISILYGLQLYLMNLCNFSEKWICDNPLVQWIGKKSYLIYLWHYPILFALRFFVL